MDAVTINHQVPHRTLEVQLYEAVNSNDIVLCQALLTKGVEVNAYAHCGRTVLGRAVQLGRLGCIHLLLNALDYWQPTSNDDQQNIDGNLLNVCVSRRRCDVNLFDYYERTPLHYAAELGNVEVLSTLLEACCRVNVADSENITPLHLAASRGHEQVVEILLKAGCQVDRKTSDKASALHVAASHGYAAVVEILLKHGATVDALDTSDRTPLLLAVNRCNREAVGVLLNHGAKVNIEEIHGYTPLAEAVWQKDEAMVCMLLDAGAKVTKSHFLLHCCVRYRNFRLVKLLLESGCLVNLRDDSGDTPVHIAARFGELDILDILLRYGANVNYPNLVSGTTALHEAVQGIRDEDWQLFISVLEKLLEYRCRLDAESYTSGDFPLYRAISLEKFNLSAVLISYGCDVNKGHIYTCNVDSLCLARRMGSLRIAKMLVYGGFNLSKATWLETQVLSVSNCDSEPSASSADCDLSITPQVKLKRWLVNVKTNPLNLIDMCRIVVRRSIVGENMHKKICEMNLPQRLKRYLLLEDVES